jgi:UDP-glucose 4-epimerase
MMSAAGRFQKAVADLLRGASMRMLITGGAGFIGSNLAKLALANDVEVTILDDLSTGYRKNIVGLDVAFLEGSILDVDAVRKSLVGVDSVIHLAALGSVPRSIQDPMATHAANATGTLTVLDEARQAGIRQFVVSSSSSVYGMNPALPKSEREWVRPMSPYAVSKLATEQYVLAYQQSFGMDTLAFRFFNVYGPGQTAGHAYAAVIPVFIDALLDGRPLPVNGDGLHSRDFTYVATVCRVLLDAVTRQVSNPEPVNLAFGTNTTLNELVQTIGQVTGRPVGVEHRDARPGDVKHSQADNSVLRSLFPGVDPVTLEQGIAETVAWFEASR